MIPKDYISEWRRESPWIYDSHVEQDLVISRAIAEIFSVETLANSLVFRGGTALFKLYLRPAARYSEDLDFTEVTRSRGKPRHSWRGRIAQPALAGFLFNRVYSVAQYIGAQC